MQISSNINRVTKFGYVGSLVGCASVGGVLVLCFYYWNVLLSTHNYFCICHLLEYRTGLCALYYNSVYCNFCFYVRVTITIVLFAIRYPLYRYICFWIFRFFRSIVVMFVGLETYWIRFDDTFLINIIFIMLYKLFGSTLYITLCGSIINFFITSFVFS